MKRGITDVKGKGPTRTWLLECGRSGPAVEPLPPSG